MKHYKNFTAILLTTIQIYATQVPVTSKQASFSQLSLDQIYAQSRQKNSDTLVTRSKPIIPTQKTTALFTQSQAHMSVPEIKKLITTTYDTKKYNKFIDSILNKEKEYTDYYVFYHGTDNVWRTPQDLYTHLYMHFKKMTSEQIKNFIFLRFNGINNISINNFLINQTIQLGLINDHLIGNDLIAVNLALFGNVGTPPECTWEYFIKSRGHANPTQSTYENILNKFGLSHTYIKELMTLTDLYKTNEQTILQIFVPKDKVDSIGYLAWIRGIPADQEIMHAVTRSVQEKKFAKTTPALDYYSALLKEEQEQSSLFKKLIERINSGEFSLSYFLDFYRNRPNEIKDINNFQARLFLTSDVLLNPLSGVKIFRYSTATNEQIKKYEDKLQAIIKKIVSEKK